MFGFFKKKPAYFQVDEVISADAGMWCLWDLDAYEHVDSYDAWEVEFCEDEDILRQIQARTFVPINLFSDGCCKFRLKVDGQLEEKERAYLLGESQEYLFRTNGQLALTGLESAGHTPEDGIFIELEPGAYSVKAYAIDWEEDPDSVDANGDPTEDALPEFIIILTSDPDESKEYFTGLETFKK